MATDSSTFRRLGVLVPLGILLLGVQLLFAGSRANAALSNRYSFTTDASDSVAQQDGVLVGTNGSVAGGQLVLANQGEFSGDPGAAGAYLDLPNGLISNAAAAGTNGAVTIEMWVTMDTNRDWAAAFTAGTNLGGEDAASGGVDSPYIQIIPRSGDGGLGNDLRVTSNAFASAEGFVDDATDLAIGVREHLVAVFDQLSGLPGAVTVYRNGVLVPATPDVGRGGVLADNLDLTAFLNADNSGGDVNVWLGRSQFNDPLATARYDEFRVYSHALTIDEAIAGTILGPDVIGETSVVSVEVNRTTGGISLRNNTASAVSLEYYKLSSSAGGLLPQTWDSLDSQNYNAVDGPDGGGLAGDSDGEGWDASASSSATQLIELFLGSGGSVLEPQASLDLGLAYITLTPQGPTYETVIQGVFDASAQNNLILQLYSGGGTETLITAANETGAGFAETINAEFLPGGEYFVRVQGGRDDANQFYRLDIALSDAPVAGASADLNLDGNTDLADWAILVANSGASTAALSNREAFMLGDLDLDGDNDYLDFKLFKTKYAAKNGVASLASLTELQVPEPTTWTLAAGLLLSVAGLARVSPRGARSPGGPSRPRC